MNILEGPKVTSILELSSEVSEGVIVRMRAGNDHFSLEVVTSIDGRLLWIKASDFANIFGYDPARGFANLFRIEVSPQESDQRALWLERQLEESEWVRSQHGWKLRPEAIVTIAGTRTSGITDIHAAHRWCLRGYEITLAWLNAMRFGGLALPEGLSKEVAYAFGKRFEKFVKQQREAAEALYGSPR